MIKFLKEMYRDYRAAQNEIAKMGIYNFPTSTGFWSFVDQDTLKKHIAQKENKNNEPT